MFNLLIIKDDLFCFYIKTEQQKVKHIKGIHHHPAPKGPNFNPTTLGYSKMFTGYKSVKTFWGPYGPMAHGKLGLLKFIQRSWIRFKGGGLR